MAQGFTYAVDLVFCIDATGSMSPVIDKVKHSALSFYDDLSRVMGEKDKRIDTLRIRAISFRDYYADTEAMIASRFFALPDESTQFSEFVNAVKASGGGDEPESGLEALATAIVSPWTSEGTKQRHVVVLWTDASAHALEKAAEHAISGYPQDIPKSFDAITDLWEAGQGALKPAAKRLILFTPDAYPWSDIATHWTSVLHYPSRAGEGLAELDYGAILDAIANSV